MKFAFAMCVVMTCALGQEGTGPFPAILEQDPGLATHTVYRPQDLSKLKRQKLPIIAWGEGGCANNGLAHRNFLVEIASYGFLAVAIGPPQAGPAGGAAKGAVKGKQANAGPATKSSQLIDAINWAITENGRKDSKYYGELDTDKIAVMGMSCGGIQSYAVATDPRIKLIGIWNSGILTKPLAPGAPAMEDVRKDQLEKLHSPIFYVTGDKSDIAYENGLDDFQRITKVPAIHMCKDGVSHGGTYSQPNGGEFGKIGVAMLQWQLKGDKEAAKMFIGANCGLCQDPTWHVSNKGMK
ncbi:MAG: alpha/beta hydrolase [Bryobacteraceae bacterium]